jgi:L-gulono-1,4-lactone dehydrogenase
MADVAAVTLLSGLLLGAVPFAITSIILGVPAPRLLCAWAACCAFAAGLWHTTANNNNNTKNGPWTSAWRTHAALRLEPADEAELRAAVLEARRPIRVAGSGHSWSATGHTHGTLIDIRRLNAIRAVNATHITVQAGAKVQDVAQLLLMRGLCLYGTGSIREQAIGGVIAHGVHGAHADGFNRHVVGLRVLLANGTFVNVTQEDDLFMWRASVGMLGAIVEATLEVFPVPTLRFTRVPIRSADDLRTTLPFFAADTFTAYLYPSACASMLGYARLGHVIHTTDTTSQKRELDNQTDFAARLMLHFNDHMHPAMQYIWPPFGTLVSCIEQALASWGHSLLLSGPDEALLPNDGLIPRFYEIVDYEYMLPLAHCATFARELLIEERFGRVLIPVCLRRMRAERSCLSMAYVDSCVFGVEAMRGHVPFDALAIERRVGELGGAAHLGKVSISNFRAYAHPCLPRFHAYRARMDPHGVFYTPFLAGAFGSVGEQEEFPPPAEARADARARARRFAALFWLGFVASLGWACFWKA